MTIGLTFGHSYHPLLKSERLRKIGRELKKMEKERTAQTWRTVLACTCVVTAEVCHPGPLIRVEKLSHLGIRIGLGSHGTRIRLAFYGCPALGGRVWGYRWREILIFAWFDLLKGIEELVSWLAARIESECRREEMPGWSSGSLLLYATIVRPLSALSVPPARTQPM